MGEATDEPAAPKESEETIATGDDGDEGEWREALANTGKVYYWNAKTRETRWEKPDSMKDLVA